MIEYMSALNSGLFLVRQWKISWQISSSASCAVSGKMLIKEYAEMTVAFR